MSSGTLRLGVIGAGAWTVASHLPTAAQRPGEVEFVAVCRKGKAELDNVANTYGFKVRSEDYRDVLSAGVDACIVASPASLHFEHALAALEAGAHVLVEKPMTIEPEHARILVTTADRVDRSLVVSFGWNYLPTYRKAFTLVSGGALGTIEHMGLHMGSAVRELLLGDSVSSTGNPDDHADTSTWTDPALSGGGYGQAQLSHAMAFALGISGLRAHEVYALGFAPRNERVELHTAWALRFSNGATGAVSGMSFQAGAQENRHQLEIRLVGSEGQLHVDLERDRLWMWERDAGGIEVELPPGAGLYECSGPVNTLIDLALGRPVTNLSPGDLGAATVEVLEAASRSMTTRAPAAVRT
jgi:predicted dehydrogenase